MYVKSFDGVKIWYRIKRKNKPFLVFVHGWVNDWTAWKKEIEFFEKKGCSTLAIDLRGHGQSDKPENKKSYQLKNFAKDIHEVIKKEKIKDYVLVGHSMGGMISLTYYKLFHRLKNLKALILCDTTYRTVVKHNPIEFATPFLKHVVDFLIEHESINKEHFNHVKDIDLNTAKSDINVFLEGLHNTPMKSVFACLEAMVDFNLKDVLKKIHLPVQIIEGEKDSIIPKIDSMEMYKRIKNAELDMIPKGKHSINIENPEDVDKYILKFLSKNNLLIY